MSPSPSRTGHAFTRPSDGDMRGDLVARHAASTRLGIPSEWATVDQVHAADVVVADRPGSHGSADAIVTAAADVPLAIFTADCLGVVVSGSDAVGVAHAGWRGLAAGVLQACVDAVSALGSTPLSAHIGPAIGPCCFEVGEEVADLFPEDVGRTTWGTVSVDLRAAARRRLPVTTIEEDERCTACGGGPSHRRERTDRRMATLGWLR